MDPSLVPETLMGLLKTPQPPTVVDVRKRAAFEADPAMVPGAIWRDPHAVEQWAAKLPPGCSGRAAGGCVVPAQDGDGR